jgi:hypothetical protein
MKKLTKWQTEIEVQLVSQRRELKMLRSDLESTNSEIVLNKMADAELTQRITALVMSLHACSDAPVAKPLLSPLRAAKVEPFIDSDFFVDSFCSVGKRAEGDLKQIVVAGQFDADINQGPLLIHVLGGSAYRLRDAHKVHITMTEMPE